MNGESLPIESLYEWTRQLAWHHPEQDIPHSFRGTCFLFAWRGRHTLATAAHCVRGRPGHPWVHAGDDVAIPFVGPWSMGGGDPDDTDICDLAVFLAPPNRLSAKQREVIERVDLERYLRRSDLSTGASLVVPGFATRQQFIDYDDGVVASQMQVLAAEYEGPADYSGCHWLRFAEGSRLEDFDGYSGSPVLRWLRLSERKVHVEVVGVLVRASSGRGVFVDARVLGAFLNRIDTLLQAVIGSIP
jgi:hypothetical protein